MPLFELIWWFLKTQLKLIPKVYKKTEFESIHLWIFLLWFTTYFIHSFHINSMIYRRKCFFFSDSHDFFCISMLFLEIQWFFPKYSPLNMHILVALFKMTIIVPLDHEKRPRHNRQQLDFHHKCKRSPNKSLFYHYYVSYNK